ncbi:MAG: hypothetical protein ACLP5E_02665 [Streptosporangiaceae bacterium]
MSRAPLAHSAPTRPECRAALSVLADHVPGGSRLALAGRTEPPLRIARLRAEGRILEIGPGDMSLTREEASSLLRNAEVAVVEEEVAEEGHPMVAVMASIISVMTGRPTRSTAGSTGTRPGPAR